MKLTELTVTQSLEGLSQGDFTSEQLIQSYIQRIESKDAVYNAYITKNTELALEAAIASDKKRQSQKPLASLEGLPVAVKDLFCTKGVRTTAASRMLENFIPPYESTVTSRLWEAGAINLGKVNLDEFAMGSTNLTSYYGGVRNPWTPANSKVNYIGGGSSGGSAVAVAAELAPIALGTDTGGSIRLPALYNGLVGVRPTYGRCSRWGVIAFASSLDQPGVISKTVADNALLLKVIAGHDPKDSTSAQKEVESLDKLIGMPIKGKKVAYVPEFLDMLEDPEEVENYRNALKICQDQGAEIVEVTLPHSKYAVSVYYSVATAEASSNLSRYDGVRYGLRVSEPGDSLDDLYKKTRSVGFGEEVQRRILLGTQVLSAGRYDAYFGQASRVRTLIKRDFEEAFKVADIILSPTAPGVAYPENRKRSTYEVYQEDMFTIPANFAGCCSLSVPTGVNAQGLPQGIQIIGRPFAEAELYQMGAAIESQVPRLIAPEVRS